MFLIIVALVVIWLIRELYWKRRNLPPGPIPFPVAGNLPQMILDPPGYNFHQKCSKVYGKIYTIWIGTSPVVCIGDLDLMKETFVKDGDSYTDKFTLPFTQEFRGGDYGVVDTSGERWREHRRFALHQLRDLGLGKMKMEERILIEVEDLSGKLLEHKNLDIFKELHHGVGNVINQLLFGYRFENEKKTEFEHLVRLMDKQRSGGLMNIVILLPFTKNIPILKNVWKNLEEFKNEFFLFFQKQIDEHVNEVDFDEEDSTDYVEAFLKEKKKREEEGDFDSFCSQQLLNMCLDLWSAGLSTTTGTLCWGILYLLHHPNVQDKIHDEMDRVIGSGRAVRMSDKNDLPYTLAVVHEIQRALNMLVTNLVHQTTRDVEVLGYKLPKGTSITANVGNLMYDEKVFPNAEKFDPERFITADGKFKKYEEFLPFSIGKRQCPGEGLARMELFLMIANLCNRFTFSCPGKLPSLKKDFVNIQQPCDSLDLLATPRF